MDTKNNTAPENQNIKKVMQMEPQNEDILEELMTVWQQHSERIEQIARHHDLSQIRLAPRPLVFSSRRRSVFSFVAVTLVCLATIVCMVILRRHFISDTIDLLFFLLLVMMLMLVFFHNLSQLRRVGHTFIIQNSKFKIHLSRAVVLASVVVLFLFIAVPVQSGRSMSHTSLSQRSAAITNVSSVLSHIR